MFPLDTFIAIAIITTPQVRCDKALMPEVRAVALRWEILDPYEGEVDEDLLQFRYERLRDAPMVHDSMRFPDGKQIVSFLVLNKEYREFLLKQQSAGFQCQEAIEETEELYNLWTEIRHARTTYYYVSIRREALKKARDMMGENNFYNGTYPPPVPLWRFKRID